MSSSDSDVDIAEENILINNKKKFYQCNNSNTQDDISQRITHDFFQIPEGKLYNLDDNYINRDPMLPFIPYSDHFEEQKVCPEPTPYNNDQIYVIVNNLQSILPGNIGNRKFIHSWVDLNTSNTAEAYKNIVFYINSKYFALDKTKSSVTKIYVDSKFTSLNNFSASLNINGSFIRVFHYIGIGFPNPRENAICVNNGGFSESDWYRMDNFKQANIGPTLFIFDCNKAEILKDSLTTNLNTTSDFNTFPRLSAMFACGANETLHIPEHLPKNLFTCILIDPIRAVNALVHNVDSKHEASFSVLLLIFSEAIALDTLDTSLFKSFFRGCDSINKLWRHFLLAQRLMKSFGITCSAIPRLPDCSEHPLWQQFEYSLRMTGFSKLEPIVTLYRDHFLKIPIPTKAVLAFISSALKSTEYFSKIVVDIASFMKRSPKNVLLIAPYIDAVHLSNNREAADVSIECQRSWVAIISGIALVLPTIARNISNLFKGQILMKQVNSPETDEEVRRYLISFVMSLSNEQTHLMGFLGNETNVAEVLKLSYKKGTDPRNRQWCAILARAIISRSSPDPTKTGMLNIHHMAACLMRENCSATRAMGVGILSGLLSQDSPEFSAYLVMLALPAAVDGSSRVRKIFLGMIHTFYEVIPRQEEDPNTDPVKLKDILNENKVGGSTYVKHLQEIIEILTTDPNDDIRAMASTIQHVTVTDEQVGPELVAQLTMQTQKEAHTALFMENTPKTKRIQRYPDCLIERGGLEHFETLHPHENSGAITALGFDIDHINIMYGSRNGTVVWGNNSWRTSSSTITDIISLPNEILAVATAAGHVYIHKNEYKNPMDSFIAGVSRPEQKTVFASNPGDKNVFINNGSLEVVKWDLESLLPICDMLIPCHLTSSCVHDNELIIACNDSVIRAYDTRTLEEIYTINSQPKNRYIIRIGFHMGKFYTAGESGPVVFYDNRSLYKQTSTWSRSQDVILHPTLPYGLLVCNEATLVDSECRKIYSMQTQTRATKCSIDGERPLCALGCEDGSVSIWRLPSQ